jgi:hypothetical protein
MADLFERLAKGRPPEEKDKQPQKSPPAQRMLDWLQRWNKPTISVRDIRIWGPRIFRDPKKAIDTAQVLVRNQWLIPTKPRRREPYRWQVVRKNIVHPTVES